MKIFVTGTISFSGLKELHEKMLMLYGKDIQFMHTSTTDIVRFETKKERYKARIKALLESDILVVPYITEFQPYRQIEIEIAEHCSISILHEKEIDSKLLSKLMKERDDQNESGSGENANDERIGKFCYICSYNLRPVDFDGDILYYEKFVKDAGDKTNLCDGCGFKERCGNRKDVDRIYCPGYVPENEAAEKLKVIHEYSDPGRNTVKPSISNDFSLCLSCKHTYETANEGYTISCREYKQSCNNCIKKDVCILQAFLDDRKPCECFYPASTSIISS